HTKQIQRESDREPDQSKSKRGVHAEPPFNERMNGANSRHSRAHITGTADRWIDVTHSTWFKRCATAAACVTSTRGSDVSRVHPDELRDVAPSGPRHGLDNNPAIK